jgi:Fe-S cluster assembly scaffold protein SufB
LEWGNYLKYYESFNTEALELSKSLPDEKSELYKRYSTPLPLERFVDEGGKSTGEEASLRSLEKKILDTLKIRFDLVFGSTWHVVNNGKFIRVIDAGDLTEERMSNKMYKSGEDKAVAFIHAYSRKIVFVDVPDGESAEVNVLVANTDAPLSTQVLINVGRESRLSLFEWHASETTRDSFAGVLHEVHVGKYGKAEVNLVHNEDANTYVVGFSKGKIDDNGLLKVNYIYNGGLSVKSKNEMSAAGYAARSEVIEMVMGSGEQKFDLNTVIANVDKDTVSDLESKAVLMDSAVCLLKGFANVGENASGSRSFVNERGILLDKRAYMSSIPGMSINNSNVKATHSSATAPIEEDLLFYLMSRGTDAVTAKKLIVSGFFSNSIAKMESAIVKEAAVSLMNEKINNKVFGTIPKMDISSIWFDEKAVHAQGMFAGHYKYRDQK